MSYKNSCGYLVGDKSTKTGYKCNHPTDGKVNNDLINKTKLGLRRCDDCKKRCGGIYPSQIPKYNISDCNIDIIDKNGNII